MDRLYYLDCLVPAGTTQAAPAQFPFPLEDATLKHGAITVPDGHNGLTGVKITWSRQQIWPWANNKFLVANNRVIPFEFGDYITVSGLVVVAYNTDIFDHTFYVEMLITDAKQVAPNVNATTETVSVVPTDVSTVIDPLGPDALIASLPADALSGIVPDLSVI